MPVNGPDLISIRVSDLERSAVFSEEHLGLTRQPGSPHAIVFDATPIAFAVREPAEGFDPSAEAVSSGGAGLRFHAPDTPDLHSFVNPGGCRITVHERA